MIPNRCSSELRLGCGWLLVGLCLAASANTTSQTHIHKTEFEATNNGTELSAEDPSLQTSVSHLKNELNKLYNCGNTTGGDRQISPQTCTTILKYILDKHVNNISLSAPISIGPDIGVRGKKLKSDRLPFYWGSNQNIWGKIPYESKSNIIHEPKELTSTRHTRVNGFEYSKPKTQSLWGSNQNIWGRRKRNVDEEGHFWVSRGKKAEDEETFWISRGKRDATDYWGSNEPPYYDYLKELNVSLRGKKDEDKTFWLARGRKDDTSQPFWLARGKKEDGSQPFWLARGKKEDGSQPFWLARGKKDDANQPFWLARGRKDDPSQPFWLARGKKENGNQPFWLARGKKEDNSQPFWLARGKKDDSQPFWLARGKKDNVQPFWLARGKKEDESQPFWLARGKKEEGSQPFWMARGKKNDEIKPNQISQSKKDSDDMKTFYVSREKKQNYDVSFLGSKGNNEKSRYSLSMPGKKEDKSSNPFWVVRGRRTPSMNSNSSLNEEPSLLIYLLHILLTEQEKKLNSTQSLRNKKYGLPTPEQSFEKNLMKNFMPVRG